MAAALGTPKTVVHHTTSSMQDDATERVLWQYEANNSIGWSSPTVIDGTVFIGGTDGTLYALGADDGTETWSFQTGGPILSSPTVVGRVVFVGNRDGRVYGVTTDTADEQWEFTTWLVLASPTVVGRSVLVGNATELHAVSRTGGVESWLGDVFLLWSTPVAVENTIYAGDVDGAVHALDGESGELEWSFSASRGIQSAPTVANGSVFVGSRDGRVYALSAETGEQEWSFPTWGGIQSSPTVVDGTVMIGSNDFSVYALSGAGEKEWSFKTEGQVRSSPTVAGDRVFVGSDDGYVYALSREDGDKLWEFETGGPVRSSPTVVDGTVYVGSNDNRVYALNSGVSGASEGSRVRQGALGHHHQWPESVEVALTDYTDENGIADTDTLREAVAEWRLDMIGTDLLKDVIDAWRSGISV